MTPVRLEPAASRSRVKHSTTEPLRSLYWYVPGYNYDFNYMLPWSLKLVLFSSSSISEWKSHAFFVVFL